jgi:hypothetical protein
MKQKDSAIAEVIEATHYFPSISIIMPFEPKMSLQSELKYALKTAVKRVTHELEENYNSDMVSLVSHKLELVVENLNYSTHKKSIAIYVSPVFEKVLYLDMPVEEKIVIDESFEIRDLLYCKKEVQEYLVLMLSGRESRLFLGNANNLTRIVSNTPEYVDAYVNDMPEKVSNFSDQTMRKEIVMDKFLLHVDQGLDIILNAYHLPLFVLGTKRIVGHFKAVSKHTGIVVAYVHGNYEGATLSELSELLKPYITDWKKIKQRDLLNQLEEAHSRKKVAIGMLEVWQEAMHRRGRLLLVEKNYIYAAQHGVGDDIIYKASETYNKFSCIKDAVDDVIEKVLENGGDVEFMDEDVLEKYNHIALVLFY